MSTRRLICEYVLMAAALLVAVLAFMAGAAHAQAQAPVCAPREQVLASLTGEKYNEQPMIELDGTPTGLILHLYGNPVTGTWTFVGFPNPLVACILATGKKMRLLKSAAKGPSL